METRGFRLTDKAKAVENCFGFPGKPFFFLVVILLFLVLRRVQGDRMLLSQSTAIEGLEKTKQRPVEAEAELEGTC